MEILHVWHAAGWVLFYREVLVRVLNCQEHFETLKGLEDGAFADVSYSLLLRDWLAEDR